MRKINISSNFWLLGKDISEAFLVFKTRCGDIIVSLSDCFRVDQLSLKTVWEHNILNYSQDITRDILLGSRSGVIC